MKGTGRLFDKLIQKYKDLITKETRIAETDVYKIAVRGRENFIVKTNSVTY